MICAACNEPTETEPCSACGESPLLDGRWRLEGLIGRGAAGTTWRAADVASGAQLAIKELPLWRTSDDKHRELAAREARVLRELSHPGIPRFVADVVAGRGKGRALYVVQEFVDGPDLAGEMEGRRYDQAQVLAILDELLGILDYLHGLSPPVVHRDVKPKNVMRRKDGRLVLVDFGSVRDALKTELGGSTVAGTFGYMAPEQFLGDATAASDLYGLGALAVALLTRKEPHTLLDDGQRVAWEPHARVSEGCAALLRDLLAKDPKRRPASAKAARERVRAVQRDLRAGPEVQRAVVTRGSWEKLPVELAVLEKPRPGPLELPQLPAARGTGASGLEAPTSSLAAANTRGRLAAGALRSSVLVFFVGMALVGFGGLYGMPSPMSPPPAVPAAPVPPGAMENAEFNTLLRNDPQLQACIAAGPVEGTFWLSVVTDDGERAETGTPSGTPREVQHCLYERVQELLLHDGVARRLGVQIPVETIP